jgi:hypothetical protein
VIPYSLTQSLDCRIVKTPWQFSLRGMFVLTAIVALCLGTGYYFPTAVAIVVVCGVAQAAIVTAADWLIRPAHRRSLALVTVVTWLILGGGLAVVGGWRMFRLIGADGETSEWLIACSFVIAGIFCGYIAWNRWRTLTERILKPELR